MERELIATRPWERVAITAITATAYILLPSDYPTRWQALMWLGTLGMMTWFLWVFFREIGKEALKMIDEVIHADEYRAEKFRQMIAVTELKNPHRGNGQGQRNDYKEIIAHGKQKCK